MKNKITMSEWAAALDKHFAAPAIPPGFKSISAIMAETGLDRNGAKHMLETLIERGLAEKKKFTIRTARSVGKTIWHYKLKKK